MTQHAFTFPKHIGVGSTNPVKVGSVEDAVAAIQQTWSDEWSDTVRVEGFSVDSGVSAQPMTDEETARGARQRAARLLEQHPDLDVAMGLEGGVAPDPLDPKSGKLWSTVWVCAMDRTGRFRFSNGARLELPEKLAEGIRGGKEMGEVMDDQERRQNLKHQEGMIGVVTGGVVPRRNEYGHLATVALALLLQSYRRSE